MGIINGSNSARILSEISIDIAWSIAKRTNEVLEIESTIAIPLTRRYIISLQRWNVMNTEEKSSNAYTGRLWHTV